MIIIPLCWISSWSFLHLASHSRPSVYFQYKCEVSERSQVKDEIVMLPLHAFWLVDEIFFGSFFFFQLLSLPCSVWRGQSKRSDPWSTHGIRGELLILSKIKKKCWSHKSCRSPGAELNDLPNLISHSVYLPELLLWGRNVMCQRLALLHVMEVHWPLI